MPNILFQAKNAPLKASSAGLQDLAGNVARSRRAVKIHFEDENWFVLDKPPGLSSHGANLGDRGVSELFELHTGRPLYLVSRLDKETSGLMICAKNQEASKRAQQIHETDESSKTYRLVATSSQQLTQRAFVVNTPLDGKAAETRFTVIESWGQGVHVLEATIKRGRKHQIRRHAAASGFPLLGDLEYGGQPAPRLFLHCIHLDWPDIPRQKSPVPGSYEALRSHLAAGRRLGESDADGFLPVSLIVALERRSGFLQGLTEAWRAVHRTECRGDFAIDIYNDLFCAWLYDESSRHLLEKSLLFLQKELKLKGGVIKTSLKNPHKEGRLCQTEVLGEGHDAPLAIREGDLRYWVHLNKDEQTGLFADQRDNRAKVRQLAEDKHVANLFAYTCSFSVSALAGGCASVVSVDNSHSALGQGLENLKILDTQPADGVAKVAKDDVRVWLARQIRQGKRYDLVICDPPTFGSASKGSKPFRIASEWPSLGESVSRILKPGGWALFCTNSRQLKTEWLEKSLRASFSEVHRHRLPFDFPESADSRHNRMFWCGK